MGRKRLGTHDKDEDEGGIKTSGGGGSALARKGNLLIHTSRIKAIAKQDPDVGGLSSGAVAAIGTATQDLLEKLLLGAAEEARTKAQSKSSSSSSTAKAKTADKVVTITPEDMQSYVLNTDELQFLRGRVEESQASGYLESYRARVREVTKASSRHASKGLKVLVGGALAGGEGDEDEEEEDEDEAVESAAAAAAAAAERGGGGGAGGAAGVGGARGEGNAESSMVLDEDYGDED